MAEPVEAAAVPERSRSRAIAIVIGVVLAALVVVVAVVLARPDPGPGHFSTWLRQDLHLSPEVVDCVDHQLRAGPLDVDAIERTAPDRLRRDGITAIPNAQRQLVGDVLIACTVERDGSGDGS